MTEKRKTERVCLMMTPVEIDAVDDWRYTQRIPTRAEAIRQLLQLSLNAENAAKKQEKAPDG
jgi:antitoxin component HigA of HigAB toxin-antitoxin module